MPIEFSPTIIVKGETFTPPKGAQESGQRALEWLKEGKAGKGFTPVGRKRASDLARGAEFSFDTLKRMKAYFDRHQVDQKAEGFNAGEKGYPSPGRVAWEAWGGDAGWRWATSVVNRLQKASESPHDALSEALVADAEADSRRGLGLQRQGKYESASFAHKSASEKYRTAASKASGRDAEILSKYADEAQQAADFCSFFASQGENHSPAEIVKGDVQGHEFHGNQWVDGTGALEPKFKDKPITDSRAKALAKLYVGTFRYTPGGVNFIHHQERDNHKLSIRKVAFEQELNARLLGKHLEAGKVDINEWVAGVLQDNYDGSHEIEEAENDKYTVGLSDKEATTAQKDVDEFMQAISERATPIGEAMYRGIRLSEDVEFTKGQVLDIPVTSWAKEIDTYSYTDEKQPTLLKMVSGAMGASLNQLGYNSEYPQTLSGGRFEVVSDRTDVEGTRIITVRQQQFYAKSINPNWKTEEPNLFPAWFPPNFSPDPKITEALTSSTGQVGKQAVAEIDKAKGVPAYPGTSYQPLAFKQGDSDWGWLGEGKRVSRGVSENDLADDSTYDEDDTSTEDTSER